MNTKIRKSLLLILGLGATASMAITPQIFAADSSDDAIEEVVTIGTRSKARSATESPAPVDVFKAEDFLNQGDTDVNNLLRNSIPSYNVNDQPISDAATLIRPANLRGLAPDHTLLLVNGKRRHRGAVITWLGNGISNGSQGPDTAAIPALALKNVEVLRDGAAAQYGSDAIAGVMNFVLKDSSEGMTIDAKYGQYSEGDGTQTTIAGNIGFPIGNNGFGNVTLEYGNSDPTDRAVQRGDAAALDEGGIVGVPNPAMVWGRPEVENDIKLFGNFGYEVSAAAELYGHANYNSKTVDGGFFYRNPANRGAVYGTNVVVNGETRLDADGDLVTTGVLLLGDLTADGTGGCPDVLDPAIAAELSNDLDGLQSALFQTGVLDNPTCFHMTEHPSGLITGGFTPRFGGDVIDSSIAVGMRGELANGLIWDISGYYGTNEADFTINNTVNASLGPNSPLNFDPGAYEQVETNLNADFSYEFSDVLNLGFGAEFRNEEFTIRPGQEESFTFGPLADQGFSTSSNGFPGFPDLIAGTWDRANTAVYLDSEWDATDKLLLQAAVRFEDFDDFGDTTNYKLGGNYRISDSFGLRSTFSTGFKAPTPGQINASNTSTEFTGGVLVNNGTIPATSELALRFGGKPLQPEESENLTFGVFFTAHDIDVTIDYFDIDVTDRLNLSTEVQLTPEDIAILEAENVPGASDLGNFRFFTNDFDTKTSGVDIVVSTSSDWLGGTTDWNLAYNNTSTDVVNFNPLTVDDARIRSIEETTPTTRWNFSGNHQMGDLRALLRMSYYGEWYDSFEVDVFGADAVDGVFGNEYLVDLELGYDLNDSSSFLLGVNNVFNEKGETTTFANNLGFDTAVAGVGNVYSTFSPFGFSGTYYYLSYRYNR